jgi:pSer/pThr/pTyr-binding forkhead associated (FHA) protein
MPARLSLFPTLGAGRDFIFREGKNHFVGRDPSSDFLLADSRVSARHALFHWTGNDWLLVDLRSKNGTYVNGTKVKEIPLQDEDWLSFGGLLARYEKVSEEQVQSFLAERATRLQAFLHARQSLDQHLEPAVLLRRLMELALDLAGAKHGFLLLVGPAGEVPAAVASGFPPFEQLDEKFRSRFEAIEKVLESGNSVATSNARADLSRLKHHEAAGIGAVGCAPLKADGRVIGILEVDGRRQGGVFTELDLELLEAVADYAAVFARNMLTVERPIRELMGSPPAALERVGSRSFLEDLVVRAESLARAARAPRPTE